MDARVDAQLRAAQVGDHVAFYEEAQRYQIQARGERYLICTRPFHAGRTVLYTIIDLEDRVRGAENLVLGAGAETRQQCEEMLARLEGRAGDFPTEVSKRNRVPLRVRTIWTDFAP